MCQEMLRALIAALLLLSHAHALELNVSGGTVTVNVDPTSGSYSVSTNGVKFNGLGFILTMDKQTHSSANKTLELQGHSSSNGSDGMGEFKSVTLNWVAGTVGYSTTFRVYVDAVVFQEEFPDGEP